MRCNLPQLESTLFAEKNAMLKRNKALNALDADENHHSKDEL